ncbi:zinc metallopeptidase [Anaerocolumna sp.]|uniref:zinc metallopeptidase n=1 Tax=Anaerocolumna sp. TaxID=2041569 RepID=UPI0028AE240E|nr:zinc metallopeptidase [Anaerocolumna sp.]
MIYGFGYYDPTFILVIIGLVLSLLASLKVKTTFAKYSKVRSMSGLTGAEAAERILHSAGIYDVTIKQISGDLTDHYDPRDKILRLSETVYNNTSVAAVGVAAHECGHAIQHSNGYMPLRIRGALVPVANFGASVSWPMILIGLFMGGSQTLINLGIILFALAVLFQLVTLPVEFNASRRAVRIVDETGILQTEEVRQTRKVLSAAALTYVAGAAASILQLLRLVILFGGRNRD